MYNSRTNPTHSFRDQHLSNQHSRRKKPQKPHHPSKVQAMNCFTAKACGRWLPLLSITLQGCTSSATFRYIPFIVSPQPRLLVQACFHSFHCAQASPLFHCIQSPPLLFPTQSTVCPAKCSPLKTKNHKSPTAL